MGREKTGKGVTKDTDKWAMIEALEALKQDLSTKAFPLEGTAAKPEEMRGKEKAEEKAKADEASAQHLMLSN